MDSPTNSGTNPIARNLRDPIWQGIGALLALVGLMIPASVAAWELITGNVRVLLWLHATNLAIPVLLSILVVVFLIAGYVLVAQQTIVEIGHRNQRRVRRMPRYSTHLHNLALAVMVAAIGLALLVTAGFSYSISRASDKTIILVADFLDPTGKDSMDVTRELVTQIRDTLVEFEGDVQVRAFGWAIEDNRGEGSADAQRIGQVIGADIVIWGDYRIEPEFVAYVHFDLLSNRTSLLSVESSRVFGDEQVQQVAASQQRLTVPSTYAFNVALGEHLGTLAAFAVGHALYDRDLYAESAKYLDTASRVYGNPLALEIEPAIHFVRGTVYMYLENYRIALDEFTAALDRLPLSSSLSEFIPPSMVLNNRGLSHALLGDIDAAMSDYAQAITLEPNHPTAYLNRGAARHSQGNFEAALHDFDQVIALDPQEAAAYYNRGVVHSDQGDSIRAVQNYSQAIMLDASLAEAYYNRGIERIALGDRTGAMDDFEKAITVNSKFASAYLNRGVVRNEIGDREGAISDLNRATTLNPRSASAYYNRGIVRRSLGDLTGAIGDYDRAIELDPQIIPAYINRGAARADLGDLKGAIRDYDQAIYLYPEFAVAYNNRGDALHSLGDYAGALRDFTQAINFDPNYAMPYKNRAELLRDQGDLAGALRDFNQAVKLNPQDAEIFLLRGAVRYALGDLSGAIDDFTHHLELAPDVNYRASLEQKIRGLQAQLDKSRQP